MEKALEIRLDLELNVGYVGYRALAEGEHTASTVRLSDVMVIDYDSAGAILGIELLDLGRTAVDSAALFASQNGLAFPDFASLFAPPSTNSG